MKILQISDLHRDINKADLQDYGFVSQLKDVDVLAICGDISGSYSSTFEFLWNLKEYIEENELSIKCIAVAGNHESYDSLKEQTYRSKIINDLRNTFNKGNIFYCENDFVDIGRITSVSASYSNECLKSFMLRNAILSLYILLPKFV